MISHELLKAATKERRKRRAKFYSSHRFIRDGICSAGGCVFTRGCGLNVLHAERSAVRSDRRVHKRVFERRIKALLMRTEAEKDSGEVF